MSNEWKIDVDGVTKDFDTDFGFKVKSWPGTGHSPVANRATPYALQDGAFFTGQRMTARTFTLLGTFYGSTTLAAFHTQRQALIKALSSRTTTINNRPATVTITYTGAAVDKEIYVVYEGGLELATFENNIENDVPIRLTAYDPSWKATSDTVTALASAGTLTLGRVVAINDGVWSALGTGADGSVLALALASDGTLYVGGSFANTGGILTNRIAKWDGSTWSSLPVFGGLNSTVHALIVAPNDNVFIGGIFTSTSSGPAITIWDGSNWVKMGTGANGAVYAFAIAANGDLYAGGLFTTVDGVSANRIAKWDGSAFTALGTGMNGEVNALTFASNGDLYAGGLFTTAGGNTANYIAKWNGTTWAALALEPNARIYALAFAANGDLYAGGDFTVAGGVVVNYVAKWNGVIWQALGSGVGASVRALAFASNGDLYAGGLFTTAGGNTANYIAKWDGSDWSSLDANLSSSVFAITHKSTNDLFIGGAFSGSTSVQGQTTISYTGTEISYPVITIKRSGGTIANIVSIVNTLTNATLNIDYSLLDGETLTIDLRPGQRNVTSSFYGLRWNAILDNSDFASWFLQSGNTVTPTDNIITAYVITTGSPTITTNMTYRTAYRSLD